MKDVKIPTRDSYHDALIEELKDSEMAAGNIEREAFTTWDQGMSFYQESDR